MMSDDTSGVAWESADGDSRLFNQNGTDFLDSLPEDSVDCVWTDPPYLLSNDEMTCVSGKMLLPEILQNHC